LAPDRAKGSAIAIGYPADFKPKHRYLKFFLYLETGHGGFCFWSCPKGNYEVPIRPKSKVGFEADPITKPVSGNGVGLLWIIGARSGSVKMIMASGWTTSKTKPPMTFESKVRDKFSY
jgi:hypothetical protein